ncbi:MAG TPA: glycosidase [Lentisphaeria bacterium]|nr:MAG: hypothetical protein A2X48_18915 [Lentisphaerae bacterium GWF2_49_21]HBC85395.1 glycosidase [Lentisphaeria bacterium]
MKYSSPNPYLTRYKGNPILQGKDFPHEYGIRHVFNSGMIKYKGKYLMMCRTEDHRLRDRFWIAESSDGYKFKPRPAPVKMPMGNKEFQDYTYNGEVYYDPRITFIDGKYYIIHSCHSSHTCRLSLLETEDFEKFKWRGFICEPDNRNGVLFPEKFNGLYCRMDRPNTDANIGDIWVSYSPDLIHWGQSRCVVRNSQLRWSWGKIGPGSVPIRTKEGWLCIFHSVYTVCNYQFVYNLGVMLLDLKDPSKCIAMCDDMILSPEMDYELHGQTPSVVFTAGHILEDDGEIKIYYGGADTVMCVATTTLKTLLDACHNRIKAPDHTPLMPFGRK